jgi:hypothetical protein
MLRELELNKSSIAKEACSFLKKRTKRLLSFDAIPNIEALVSTFPQAQAQGLLVLFFRKEHASFRSC